MERDDLESVYRRIQKLLAIAADSRGNPQEAASAAAMAHRTMLKYQISEGDVLVQKLRAGEDMGEDVFVSRVGASKIARRGVPRFANLICLQVARMTQTRVTLSSAETDIGHEACIKFMGFLPDVKIAVYTMSYLQGEVMRLRREFFTSSTYKLLGRSSVRSYVNGVALGIVSVLRAVCEEQEAQSRAPSSDSHALVMAKTSIVSERYGSQKSRSFNARTNHVTSMGYADGNRVQMHSGLEQTEDSTLMIT